MKSVDHAQLAGTVSLLLLTTGVPRTAAAAEWPAPTAFTQTLRTLRQEQNGIRGDYLISFSSLKFASAEWTLRSSLSWLAWRDDGGDLPIADDAGPGALYLTAGHRVWRAHTVLGYSQGWLRLRTKIPLQRNSNITGTGATDWGAGLLLKQHLGGFSLLGEGGLMSLGEPPGVDYHALLSGSLSVSFHPPGVPLWPLLSYAAATPATPGDPAYGEWSAGAGLSLTSALSVSALYTRGTTAISPRHGFSLSASLYR